MDKSVSPLALGKPKAIAPLGNMIDAFGSARNDWRIRLRLDQTYFPHLMVDTDRTPQKSIVIRHDSHGQYTRQVVGDTRVVVLLIHTDLRQLIDIEYFKAGIPEFRLVAGDKRSD